MDNEVLLTELEKSYNLIEASNIQIDTKASNMIMIIGAMLTTSIIPIPINKYLQFYCLFNFIGMLFNCINPIHKTFNH